MLLKSDQEDLPMFGTLKHIAVVEVNRYYFIVELLHTVCYNPHYHAYEVTTQGQLTVVQLSELADHHPLSVYTTNHLRFVIMKYHVVQK